MDLMTYLLAIQKIQEVSSDTTYTLTADVQNKTIVLTPSVGTAQVITVPYATDASTVNGKNVPELENGKIPASYLPSYVDDVEEYEDQEHFPSMGESNKIYIDLTTNKIYRWSGTTYVEISESLALGETSSTAFRGDHGKTAYDHSLITSGNPHNVTKTDIGLDNVGNFKAVSTVASQGLTTTEQENVKANIGLGVAADKDIDTSIEESSQSTNLPTTKAVSDFVQTQTDKVVGTIKSVSNLPAPIASFNGAAALPMPKLEVAIEPVQDLHGYDAPWVGGAGKNKCPINSGSITVGDFVTFSTPLPSGTYSISLKATRTPSSGSYASLVPYDKDGVAYSSIIGIASNELDGSIIKREAVVLNNGLSKIYVYSIAGQWSDSRNYTLNISNLQLEEGATATAFAPYSNICPIIGWDEVNVGDVGKNLCNPDINAWNVITYRYFKLPKFNNDSYIMSFVDKDTSVDLSGVNFGFMYNYPAENLQYRWVICDGVIQNDKTNISQVDGVTKCDTLIIYPGTQSAFEKIFARFNVQVEKGSTATAYEPYNGQTYTIDLDGTRYGGEVDVVSGVMTVTHAILTKNTASLSGSNSYPWWTNAGVKAIVGSGINRKLTDVMTNFGYENSIGANTESSNDTLFLYGSETAYTLAEWQALALDCQFRIPLATPLTIQLSPTVVKALLVSNVWSDTGNILDAQYISYEYDKICAKYSENIIPTDDFALNTTTGDITTDGDIIRKNGYWGDTYGGTHTSLIDAIDDLYNLIQQNNS